jgi:ATP-binding cassette, subfamily B, bacterial HlyB/CyaB
MHAEEAGAAPRAPGDVDTGLTCLALVARFHGKAAEPGQLAHALGLTGAAGADDLLRAASRLELKAKLGPLDLERAARGKLALPCIIELRSTETSPVFAVLARVEQGKALLHDPGEARPVTIALEELKPRLTGRALFVTSRASPSPGSCRRSSSTAN